MASAEVCFRVDAIDCSLSMERIARLVHPCLQRKAFAFWALHINRVVFRIKITGSEFVGYTLQNALFPNDGIARSN